MDRPTLIAEFVNLKNEHQKLFYKYKKVEAELERVRTENLKLKKELKKVKSTRKSQENKEENNEEEVYEVEKLLKHRGKKNNREFLVRWKGYNDHTWEKETNLSCPLILKEYAKKHRLAIQNVSNSEYNIILLSFVNLFVCIFEVYLCSFLVSFF